MSGAAAQTHGLDEWNADKRSEVEKAAVLYAEHGWPVLPGSTWNGRRYVIPGTLKVTDGLRPSVARNLASSDIDIVNRWWSADARLVPSVLLRSGDVFGLVAVAFELAYEAMTTTEFRSHAGPVMYRPDQGRAHFVVRPDRALCGDFGKPGEVTAIASGEWVAAPPTRTGNGVNVRWWSTPESVNWCPVDVAVLADALAVACRNRANKTTQHAH